MECEQFGRDCAPFRVGNVDSLVGNVNYSVLPYSGLGLHVEKWQVVFDGGLPVHAYVPYA